MQSTIALLYLCLVATAAVPARRGRIVGGSPANIEDFPSVSSLLFAPDWTNYAQGCGSSIVTSTAILTAAHCIEESEAGKFRVRVGSSFGNSGGVVHRANRLLCIPTYDIYTLDNDLGIVRLVTVIQFNAFVQPAPIAGPNYELGGNEVVFAVGRGAMAFGADFPEQYLQVQLWTIGLEECNRRYGLLGMSLSENMVCIGVMEVGGRDQCSGDSGGPLYHHGTIVGVASWGHYCAHPHRPGVNTRVSKSSVWIQNNVY